MDGTPYGAFQLKFGAVNCVVLTDPKAIRQCFSESKVLFDIRQCIRNSIAGLNTEYYGYNKMYLIYFPISFQAALLYG